MNTEEFNIILEARIEKIRKVLAGKAKEYVQNDDRLYNFKAAAVMDDETPAQALWGMLKKHLVSVKDLKDGKLPATPEMVNEKIGDTINYLILLEAVLLGGTPGGASRPDYPPPMMPHQYYFCSGDKGALKLDKSERRFMVDADEGPAI